MSVFVDRHTRLCVSAFESDPETELIVMAGEIGARRAGGQTPTEVAGIAASPAR